jgi:hypothetical protein
VHIRRRRKDGEKLPELSTVAEGQFREVKTGVLLLPEERVEMSSGRRSVVRRFLVSCLGDADAIFHRLYAQVRELGWLDPRKTMVVIVGDGAEWIWNRATWFVHRCEILDFWHALEHAWAFARLRYGDGSAQADQWVHAIAEDLRAGKVQDVIVRLKRLRTKTTEQRESLAGLLRYYSENASRMQYDEHLRLGYGIGSGAVESAHKQVIHARMRQAGMRWSEAGARRLLALRLARGPAVLRERPVAALGFGTLGRGWQAVTVRYRLPKRTAMDASSRISTRTSAPRRPARMSLRAIL